MNNLLRLGVESNRFSCVMHLSIQKRLGFSVSGDSDVVLYSVSMSIRPSGHVCRWRIEQVKKALLCSWSANFRRISLPDQTSEHKTSDISPNVANWSIRHSAIDRIFHYSNSDLWGTQNLVAWNPRNQKGLKDSTRSIAKLIAEKQKSDDTRIFHLWSRSAISNRGSAWSSPAYLSPRRVGTWSSPRHRIVELV